MKKIIYALALPLACAIVMAPMMASHASAQTMTNAQIASEVATDGTVVGQLSQVDVQRQAMLHTESMNLSVVAAELQSLVSAPAGTDAQRASISSQLSAISGQLSLSTGIVGSLMAVRNGEVSILDSVAGSLVRLESQLTL